MSFNAWGTQTEEQANIPDEVITLEDGRYKFKVYKIEHKVSKNNNNYLLLKQIVIVPGGKVFAEDSIVDSKRMFFKRKHFWESVGHPELLNALGDEYLNREGEADYKVETYYSKKYGENRQKLIVVDYVSQCEEEAAEKHVVNSFEDDDIPF